MKKGWQTKKLVEICEIERGGSPRPINSFLTNDPNGINWIKIGDTKNVTKYITKTEEKIKPEGAKHSRLVYEGDFILSNSMSFGRPYIMKTTGCIHDGWLVLRQPKVDQDYLYHILGSDLVFNQFDRLAAGSTVRNLNIGLVKTVEIPVPPLPEQQRIVGILDEVFEGIATAKANVEKNLKNARALFESHLQSVFTNRGEGWEERTLGNIAQVKGGKRVPKGYKLLTEPTDYPYLRVTEFTDFGTIDMSDLRYVSAEVHSGIMNYVIYSTDLYISIAGTIGKTGIIPEELDGANLTENACRLVFNPGVSNRFVYYFTVTPDFVMQAGLNTRTAAQPKLALSRLATIKLGIPPLVEQKRLAAEFDALQAETQRLETIYRRKIEELDALKKSILHQAFTGEL